MIPEQKKSKEEELLSTRSTRGSECEVKVENKSVKPTFMKPPVNRVSETIGMFRRLEDNGGMCVMGSGRCAYHNVKLVRSVVTRKGSVQCDTGVRWERMDSTVLICPGARQQREEERFSDNDRLTDRAVSLISGGETTTNKKRKCLKDFEDNQSMPGDQSGEPIETISLDDVFQD